MRILMYALTTALFALVPVAAYAQPSLSLVWTSTTGTGVTGGSVIEAQVGDVLEVDVVLTIDPSGFTGAAWDLVGSAGLTASANSLIPGAGGPPECPAPPNLAPGTCFSATFKSYSPLMLGVTDLGSSTIDYDVAGLTAEFVPSTMTLGRGVFTVGAGASAVETVETFFAPGVGGVTDGVFSFSVPAVATAEIIVDGGVGGTPDVSATKTDVLLVDLDGEGDVDPGDTLRYTVVISNDGDADAQAVVFTDTPDANAPLDVGSVTTSQGIVTMGNSAGDSSVAVDVGNIPPAQMVTISFDATVVAPLPDDVGSVANQGLVAGSNFDDTPSDDPDTAAAGDETVTEVVSNLDQCLEDLQECLDVPPFTDEDADGEHDMTDECPGTAPGAEVDDSGCSAEQFCGAIEVNSGVDRVLCMFSDWQNDEPLVRVPRDCRVAGGACVAW